MFGWQKNTFWFVTVVDNWMVVSDPLPTIKMVDVLLAKSQYCSNKIHFPISFKKLGCGYRF
jgi:hypothetical protein